MQMNAIPAILPGRLGEPSLPTMNCTYLLPIRRSICNGAEAEALRSYLASMKPPVAEIVVVDGSPPDVFAAHDDIWSGVCRHEPVNRRFGFLNDKVNGIQTGVRLASNEKIILADDDIRYTPGQIEKMSHLLDRFEVVRPQNYFDFKNARFSICARMEAARMLINRATLRTADYPGTCAFRRQLMLRARDYDGDVLFDNEELIRHLARSEAHISYANDFFIRKFSPTFRKWLEQRPRQAYEDFGLRAKTILFASLLPLAIVIAVVNPKWLSIFLVPMLVALAGWLRGNARKCFPLHICWFAPFWVLERSLSTYWAFYWFLTRGGYPFGERLLTRGIGRDWVEGGKIAAKMALAVRPNDEQGS